MNTRTYKAPLGATSITVNGRTFEVDGQGRIECDDEAAHADLLSHGYTYGEADAADSVVDHKPGRELAAWQRELDEREKALRDDAEALGAELASREVALAERIAELGKRAAELAARETDLTMRTFAVDQREAALAAVTPPPPPVEAAAKATKAKG